MYYYFQIKFKDDSDIYIIRVKMEIVDSNSEQKAMDEAIGIIVNRTKRLDFEIERATIVSILSQATFVEDVVTVRFTL